MELKEIGEALNIDNRTMRYLMEQGIVPDLDDINQGRGTRRNMTAQQARLVGLAAILHELGFRGPVVQSVLRAAKSQLKRKLPTIATMTRIKKGNFQQVFEVRIPLGKAFYEEIK